LQNCPTGKSAMNSAIPLIDMCYNRDKRL
jgi:hypothetical protein